jgi:hypothetical protein
VAGSTGAELATAVDIATMTNVVPGTGFRLVGTTGVKYGYQILYA